MRQEGARENVFYTAVRGTSLAWLRDAKRALRLEHNEGSSLGGWRTTQERWPSDQAIVSSDFILNGMGGI